MSDISIYCKGCGSKFVPKFYTDYCNLCISEADEMWGKK